MIPIFLLGSAVYLVRATAHPIATTDSCLSVQGLQLTQLKLSHEKSMQDATERVRALEAEIAALQERRMVEDNHQPDTTASHAKKWFRWW